MLLPASAMHFLVLEFFSCHPNLGCPLDRVTGWMRVGRSYLS
jgi:hypothetical protein